MTKMFISRSIVEQAVEALKLYVPKEDYENKPVGNVMDALREALDPPVQEPVAWMRVIDEAMVTHHLGVADPGDDYETAKRKMNNLLCMAQDIGNYFAKQAEPVQEPVYWEVRCAAHPRWMRVDAQQFDEYVDNGWEGQRLYTTPQRP